MAQIILFSCSCGWQETFMFGPTMTAPALPGPGICAGCQDVFQETVCPSCSKNLDAWDQKNCPCCSCEVASHLVALAD